MTKPKEVLDYFIFSNIHNHYLPGSLEGDWDVTYEGDNFVVRNRETGKLSHFRVSIKKHEWDSEQARIDQEWHLDEDYS